MQMNVYSKLLLFFLHSFNFKSTQMNVCLRYFFHFLTFIRFQIHANECLFGVASLWFDIHLISNSCKWMFIRSCFFVIWHSFCVKFKEMHVFGLLALFFMHSFSLKFTQMNVLHKSDIIYILLYTIDIIFIQTKGLSVNSL